MLEDLCGSFGLPGYKPKFNRGKVAMFDVKITFTGGDVERFECFGLEPCGDFFQLFLANEETLYIRSRLINCVNIKKREGRNE